LIFQWVFLFFRFSWIICRTAWPKLGASQGGLGIVYT
jgi:hypothetical protein